MRLKIDADLRGSLERAIRDLEVPAFVVGLDRTITIANETASALISGRGMRELDEARLADILGPEATATVFSWIDHVVDGHPAKAQITVTLSLNTGPELWSAIRVKNSDGHLAGFLFQRVRVEAILPDRSLADVLQNQTVTETLDDLTRRELRWKTAVLSANQGVWDHDFELNRHFLSDIWREMRGMSKGAAAAETTEDWLETMHPDDVGRVKEQIALQESGQTDVVNYTFRQRHADRHWIWVLSRGRVVRRTANGLPARIIGTDTDISDLRVVERECARLTERLRVAIEASEMGQWELDVEADTAIWDDQALQMFGLHDGISVRPETDWAKLIHPDDREATVAYNDACLRAQKDIACDYRIVTADGNEKYIRTRGKFGRDIDGGDRYIGVNLDLTEDHRKSLALEQARSMLEYESRHDALTGLANRRRLDEVFVARAAEVTMGPIGAMHLDIDRFKQINDNFGHAVGDFALKHAASILLKYLPPDVLVARIGGDEFVALFPQARDRDVMEGLATQIIDAFGTPFLYEKTRIISGISIGIASLDGRDETGGNLFHLADIALYQAKKNSRASFRFYSPDMKDQASQRIQMEDELISAFERDEITCYYQPQFDAQTLQLSGIEALVRWESPTEGLIMPDQFLSTVDDMGLIGRLEEIVLCRALADLRDWLAEGLAVPHISVNISAQRLADPELKAWLEKKDVPRGMIVFELLETVFLDGEDMETSENLRLLKTLGIDVEIDDFGTGHASIISLLRIAPKRLKIAQELVEPIPAFPK
jgi:diguanylate cyclase (GGDEF)-like protein